MVSKSTVDERIAFSDRLKLSLQSAEVSVTPTGFSRAFNLRAGENKVTVHAARKWLIGEAVPTQPKMVVLASWLRVSPSWLRFGDGVESIQNSNSSLHELAELPTPALILIHDILALPVSMQQVIRDMVDSLARNAQR